MSIEEAKLKIQRAAELTLKDGYYHIFCSARNLEYVTRTESYCTAEMLGKHWEISATFKAVFLILGWE